MLEEDGKQVNGEGKTCEREQSHWVVAGGRDGHREKRKGKLFKEGGGGVCVGNSKLVCWWERSGR